MSDLETSEGQTVLEPVFSVLLRVRVQQHIIHLETQTQAHLTTYWETNTADQEV